ncbi:type II toxin-antitoxin system RelE/ParE family toxin [soil metagenome]
MFSPRTFDKWARKESILDVALVSDVDNADAGLVDANLKGCLVKLRVARPGRGKSGGYRTIVAYKTEARAFFLYGFGKNELANVSVQEAEGYEEYGAILLELTERELRGLIEEGKLREMRR